MRDRFGTNHTRPSPPHSSSWAGRDRPIAFEGTADKVAGPAPAETGESKEFQQIKSRLHRRLLEMLDLSSLGERDQGTAEIEVGRIVRQMLENEGAPLNLEEREAIVEQIVFEVFGLGPLEPLLKDQTISDILVNGYDAVYIERDGRLSKSTVVFRDNQHLLQVIDRIVTTVGGSTTPRPWWTRACGTAPA